MNAYPIYPLPEAVDPRGHKPWDIEPCTAYLPRVFPRHRFLQVPLDGSAQARFMRNHELGHIRWSPRQPDGAARRYKIQLDVLEAVEDMRINTKLQSLKVDVESGALPYRIATATAANLARRGDARAIILTLVAAQGCGSNEGHFTRAFESIPLGTRAVEVAALARKMLWAGGEPRFKDTVRTARWLQLVLDNAMPHTDAKLPSCGAKIAAGINAALDEVLKLSRGLGMSRRSTAKVPWGRMTVEMPPRPLRVAGYLGRRRIAVEEGSVPRNIHRLLIDGRIFQRVRRGRGGTVLTDCSGSMSLASEDIQKILKHSPGACVAVYSGNTWDGVLRVLATGGRQVEKQWINAPAGGANVIDGPALQWLSKQQKPRIWVSDGQVTGIHDRTSAINSLECTALCHQRSIVRCNNVADGVKLLRGMRPR